MSTPSYDGMYVAVDPDNDLVTSIYCDQCGQKFYEAITVSVQEIIDRSAWHRLEHERGER